MKVILVENCGSCPFLKRSQACGGSYTEKLQCGKNDQWIDENQVDHRWTHHLKTIPKFCPLEDINE